MEPLEEIAAALAADCGAGPVRRLTSLKGGGNNRVYRVEADRALLLKIYFEHPGDRRDRLKSEFLFSCFAWNQGVKRLPQPLGCDPESRAGLYEFVEGRPLSSGEITRERVREALEFFCDVNEHRADGLDLPKASEACFSLLQHLQCIERRVQRLREIEGTTELRREAIDLVESKLVPAWRSAASAVEPDLGAGPDLEIGEDERCLSPSDFGFHNAICSEDGRLHFIDFEYAGWDDPAKMICDFFCQPARPAPRQVMPEFIQAICSRFPKPESLARRVGLLFPLYQLKWCCILLNEFLSTGGARRRFADESLSQAERERRQIEKAKRALDQWEGSPSELLLQT